MKSRADKIVERVAEIFMVGLVLVFAAVWDVLISPESRGTPIPVFVLIVVALLLIFAPWRWHSEE